jgi:tetratricopeptide (TPR) repeat protein
MTKGTREASIAACHRVVFKEVLGKKHIAAAYSLLARYSDNPAGVIENMDRAITLDPDTPYYYEQRGFQYGLNGDNDRAPADFEKGLALKPDARLFFVRALTYKRMGDDVRALADLDRAIALAPKEPTYYSVKAEIYLAQGKTVEALAMLDQGIAIKPDHAQFFQDRAEVYRKLGDAKGEEEALTRLIALKPKEQYGLLLRAFLNEKLGKRDLAIADYDALLALDPNSKFYNERRAALLAAKGGAPAAPAPKVIDAAGEAPPVKKAAEPAAQNECRIYVPGAGVTVAVPCAK